MTEPVSGEPVPNQTADDGNVPGEHNDNRSCADYPCSLECQYEGCGRLRRKERDEYYQWVRTQVIAEVLEAIEALKPPFHPIPTGYDDGLYNSIQAVRDLS